MTLITIAVFTSLFALLTIIPSAAHASDRCTQSLNQLETLESEWQGYGEDLNDFRPNIRSLNRASNNLERLSDREVTQNRNRATQISSAIDRIDANMRRLSSIYERRVDAVRRDCAKSQNYTQQWANTKKNTADNQHENANRQKVTAANLRARFDQEFNRREL